MLIAPFSKYSYAIVFLVLTVSLYPRLSAAKTITASNTSIATQSHDVKDQVPPLEEAAADTNSVVPYIETITVSANRQALNLKQTPLNIVSISAEPNQQQNIAHIQQLINNVSGVNFQRNSGIEYLPAIRSPVLTGSGACGSIAILENSIPIRPASFCNVNGLMETHHQLANSIEVLKGPGNSFYGSNAVFGAINILDAAALNDDDFANITLGEHGFATTKAKFSNNTIASAMSIMHSDGFRDDSQQDQQKLSLRYQTQAQSNLQHSDLTLININQNTAGYISGYQAYKDSSLSRSNPNPEAYRDVFALRMSQQYQGLESPWVFRPYIRYNDMEFALHFLPGKPIEKNSHVSVGSQFQYNYDLSQTEHSQFLHLGVDIDLANIDLSQYQPSPTQGSDFLEETIPEGKQYDFSVNAYNLATFAQYHRQISETVAINLGVRLEYNVYDYQNHMNSGRLDEQGNECGFGGCRYNRPRDSADQFLDTSINLGATYQLFSDQQLFINANSGFRPPQISEMYRLQREQNVSNLDSESIDAVELGWRGNSQWLSVASNNTLKYPLAFSLSSYYYHKEEVIFRDSDFFQINGGKTDHLGVEFSVQQTFTDFFSSDLSYSYAKHTYANNPDDSSSASIKGNDVDTAPRHFGRLMLTFNPNNNNSFTLAINHTSEYYLDINNEFEYQGHTLADLYVNSHINSSMSWQFKLLNIADIEYAERADYSNFSGYRYFPGQGRSVFVGINYQFN